MGSIPIGSIMTSQQLGILGENIATNYLRKKGYRILDRNYSLRIPGSPQKGEIDIIAKKEDVVSFIEVKALSDKTSGNLTSTISPEEKVNFRKQRKLMKTAESWLMKKKTSLNSKWQIDVISIKINLENKKAKIRHFKNVACE